MHSEGSKNSENSPAHPQQGGGAQPEGVFASGSRLDSSQPRRHWSFRSVWLKLTPYFLSALLYLSGFFAVFAPLPLLVQSYLGVGLSPRLLATLTNGLAVLALADPGALVLYGVLVLPVVWFLPLLFERVRKPETAILVTAVSILVFGLAAVAGVAVLQGGSPWQELNSTFDAVLKQVYEAFPQERRSELLGDQTLDEWVASTKLDMPWRLLTLVLFWVFANGMILLRWNPRHIRERLGLPQRYFAEWKAPEVLIVPVLIFGALTVFGKGIWGAIGSNGLYTVLAVFAIQGLSVMSFLMDLWGLYGPMRSILYGIGLLVMLPLILAVGFFDTWFDFRERLRQR